jgi:hypothetical protein
MLVKDANDSDLARHLAIENNVRADQNPEMTGADGIAPTATPRIFGDSFNSAPYIADVAIGLINPPLIGRIVPDILEIGLSLCRKNVRLIAGRLFSSCSRASAQ